MQLSHFFTATKTCPRDQRITLSGEFMLCIWSESFKCI